ncbi:LRK-1 protein [Aphelenchoides avenae]|nr:LRK-1 protein [Aphelenchus avenae]
MAADDDAAELVLQAVLYNNADLLRELLSENPSALHHKDPIGRGALHYAAARGQVECVRIIINAGVDVDTSAGLKDALKTPLQLASEMGHLRVVDMLVEAGADVFHTDANGYSALQLAQMNDQRKTAERLLAAIEGLRQEVAQLRSQLYTACIDGNEAAVHDVLARMPQSAYKQVINGEQMDEKSALYIASEHGRADIVRSLLTVSDHNIIYVPTGDNVLHAAVSSQNADTVSTILRKFHFLMDAANNEGSLPLHWACRCGDADVVRILMEFPYPESEMKFIEDGHGRFCYKYVCDLNSADNDCRTPLYLAVANGHTAVVYYLANYKLHLFPTDTSSSGSDRAPSPDNSSGARYGCPFLLDVYSRNGRTPLMTACASGNEGIVRTLLDNNVDVNLPIALTDAEISSLKPMEEVHCAGSGALVEAARTGNMRLVKLLLSHGALDYNNRALAMAVKSKNKELVAVLLCQLVSPDNENRVNKKRASELTFLHNAASGALLNVIPNMFPSNSTQLNWHNASLTELLEEWLIDSGMQLNPRIRQPRYSLLFSVAHFPQLETVNAAGNRLRHLPSFVWTAPALKELNVSNNEISIVESTPRNETPSASDRHQRRYRRHFGSRSKSVVRNQRAMSAVRITEEQQGVELCVHKSHSRFEALKTLNLANNNLSFVDLLVSLAATAQTQLMDSGQFDWKESLQQMKSYLICPVLTTLDLSNNNIRFLPPAVSLLSSLTVLILNGNKELETLPPELGLLDKLWNIGLKDCPLKEPLRGIVTADNYKTSKSYAKLKLMFLGAPGVGKTQLLLQMRTEGQFSKKSIQSESWSRRLGHSPTRGTPMHTAQSGSDYPVDVSEWTYAPRKSSSKGESNGNGPITFRMWDFNGLQKECHTITQYFLSRRAVYLVVWKVTDGEIAMNEIHEWLLTIQARAPNATVVIVGTHSECLRENAQRFTPEFIDDLERIIQHRFVNVPDADKKGLPRVAASVYVSSKTRDNVKSLCNLIYQIALELRSPGRRQRLLAEKVPAAFCALEKIVVNITDELRKKAEEAVLKTDRFWTLASSRMIEQYGKPFRDRLEFDQACAFLHENGVLVHFDDTALRDYYFIDPPWLCSVLQSILACSDRRSSLGGGSMHEASFMPSSGLYSSLKSSIRRMQSAAQSASSSERQKVMRACMLNLLSKFEVALPCLNRMVVLHSLLPDEYILRADYPGAKVKVRTKIDKWQIRRSLMSKSVSPTHGNLPHRRLVRTLAYRTSVDEGSQSPRLTVPATFPQSDSTPPKVTVTFNETGTLRRLSLMQYIPPGFWPRLTTRLLDDDKLGTTMSRMFTLTPDRDNITVAELQSLNAACNMAWDSTAEDAGRAAGHLVGGFQWMIWQTGLEVLAFGSYVFSVKQFLPLANVRDVNYLMVESYRHSDDDVWRPASMDNAVLIELLVPSLSIVVEHNGSTFKLVQDRRMATKFFALVSNILDDLLEDWFPALGTRYVHTSEGRLLVDRLVPCYECATAWRRAEGARQASAFTDTGRINDDRERGTKANPIYLFSLDECILHARDKDTSNILSCPEHGRLSIDQMAPDVAFGDLSEDFVKPPENIRRGKLVGRGAFGFVFNGFVRQQNDRFVEVALKVLEPVDPGSGAKGSDLMAFEAFRLKWRNDILESSARAYHTVRQELNMVMELKHQHVTALLAFARRPLTLIVELAPHGALQDILTTYRRYDTRLPLNALGQTSVQVAKALEYLHANHIIYRDLKSENVLVWRFPPPHGGVADVQVKLGDYGISRYSYPSGVCMGYGGTEGFMAPEIMRYNGEQQYTEKVDCFSFGMFLYELISLKQPYDGQEQMKESILEGRRPYVSEKDLLMPSNVLDLMVVCWSEDAENRPSSSQLVCICSAPEYTHLLDVAILPDKFTFSAAAAVLPGSDEEADAAQLWMCAEDGSLITMTCSTLGWVDKKVVLPMEKRKQHPRVTAMCPVEESVYVADQASNIRVYSSSTPNEFSSLHVSSLKQKSTTTDPSVNHILFFAERRYVLFVQRTSISICAIDDGELPTLVNTVELADDHWISSVAVIPSLGDWQIWTGHEHGKVILHHINGVKTRLVYAASVSHVPDADPSDLPAVRFIVASAAKPNIVYSALEQDGRLFQWKDGVVTKSLNVCKLLPVSESLSSMNIESARNNYVTSLIVHDVNDNETEQVVVGTSNGIIVIVQSGEVLHPRFI